MYIVNIVVIYKLRADPYFLPMCKQLLFIIFTSLTKSLYNYFKLLTSLLELLSTNNVHRTSPFEVCLTHHQVLIIVVEPDNELNIERRHSVNVGGQQLKYSCERL